MITFQRETIKQALNDIIKHLPSHHSEVKDDGDLNPNFEHYLKLEENNNLVIFTVRGDDNLLFGYAAFVLSMSLHSQKLNAYQDILYLVPGLRNKGFGEKFILWCDEELKAMNVSQIIQEVRPAKDFSRTLERAGYKYYGSIYAKRLDKI